MDIPLLGFGTWRLSGTVAYDAVRVALDAGCRHIDTATMYGNEAEVGRAVADSGIPREEIFLTTKLPPEKAGAEEATLAASLRALAVDYVDLWLVHWPPGGQASPATWEHFLAAADKGLAATVGVSNYSVDQIDELTSATGRSPAVNQIRFGPALYSAGLLAEHRSRSVVVEGYSPFRTTDLSSPVLGAVAAAHGVTPAQVVVRWHAQHEVVVIPRSSNPERVRANFDVMGFELSAGEMAAVDGMAGGAH